MNNFYQCFSIAAVASKSATPPRNGLIASIVDGFSPTFSGFFSYCQMALPFLALATHRRLADNDPFSADMNQCVGRAKIDSDVMGN